MSEGKNTAAELSVKLVIDSDAKKATDDMKDELSKLERWNHKWGQKIGGGMSKAIGSGLSGIGTVLTTGVGFAAAGAAMAVGGITAAAYHSVDAFQESQKQVKQLAGTLTMIDQKGNAFSDIKSYASDLKDELEELAIQFGTTDDVAVQTFDNIVERGGKSVEQAQALTREMMIAGRAFPGGPEALSQGFSMMEMGMVRARNPLVQMIAATHTLKGSAKDVARELQKMPLEKQLAIAEKAIGSMSKKMGDVPMSLGEMKASLGTAVENVFEDAGKPILGALKPIVSRVRGLFLENRGAIGEVAAEFGNGIAKGLDFALDVMNELIVAVKANWKDISGAFKELRQVVEPIFRYIYENKGSFAKTFADIAVVIIKAFTYMVKAIAWVYDTAGSMLKAFGKVIPALGDFIRDEEQGGRVKKVGDTVQKGATVADQEKLKREFVAGYMKDYGADKQFEAQNKFDEAWTRAMENHEATMAAATAFHDKAVNGNADAFAKAWNLAVQKNDEGTQLYVAAFLNNNKELQKAIAEKGPELLGDAFSKLVDFLNNQGESGKAIVKGIDRKPDLGVTGKATINQNFNGPINIKQDFRDEDPDRVAAVFREDLARVGSSRLQSRFATPFGF